MGIATSERLQLFQALVEGARDYAIFMLDPEGFVLTWNTGAERINGYSASEIVGSHFSCFFPPDAVAAGRPEHELQVARADGSFEGEGWRVRRDGSRFWANVLTTAILDRGGNLRGFSKLTRNITERKLADERLRESELEVRRLLTEAGDRKFRIVLEAAPDALVVIDKKGKIALANKQAERLFGYDRADLVGQ